MSNRIVTVKTDLSVFERVELENLKNAGHRMATRILSDSRARAPRLTGALISDGRVRKVSHAGYEVVFGDERVPYARRRHFENRKNPQTKYYLQNAGDNVAKMGIKEFL